MSDRNQLDALARELCEADGGHPDDIVTRNILFQKGVPGGMVYFIPGPESQMPLWNCYVHLARAVIEADLPEAVNIRPGYTPDTLYDEELKAT